MQVVIFKLGDEQFAVQTSKVQTINDSLEVTKVPKAPDYIRGLINLRGNVICLLDINLLLNKEVEEYQNNNIIILQLEDELVGIAVDQVDEVLDIEEDIIEKGDSDKKYAYVKGIINFGEKIVTLVDIDKLIPSKSRQ